MAGEKARDARAASEDLVDELADPVNRDGFLVSIVDFNTSAIRMHELTPASALRGNVRSLDIGGGTNITAGLREALTGHSSATSDEGVTYLRPVFLVFSDGGHNDGPPPNDIAAEIKMFADVVSVAFGTNADEATLRSIATSPQHFYRVKTGRELRAFLAQVGATLTGTMQQRTNATQALTQVGGQ
jgi:uncharacterized protein YegL